MAPAAAPSTGEELSIIIGVVSVELGQSASSRRSVLAFRQRENCSRLENTIRPSAEYLHRVTRTPSADGSRRLVGSACARARGSFVVTGAQLSSTTMIGGSLEGLAGTAGRIR